MRASSLQVNHAQRLKHASDRDGLDDLLAERLGAAELTTQILDGPEMPSGRPQWTSVIFSAQHGSHKGLCATVKVTLEQTGLSRYLEPWP